MNDKVSILMANYNCEKYINEAIDSILSQTYSDWELIIVDDCSSDDSVKIIKGYRDERIKLICNDENIGLAASLNKALKIATGKYIARMDPDDISSPERFEKQIKYLAENDTVAICGSNVMQFGEINGYNTNLPNLSEHLMAYLPFCSPLPHSTWMVFRERVKDTFVYDDEYRSSQDYELMYRIWKHRFRIGCISDSLVKYRVRRDGISSIDKHRFTTTTNVQRLVLEHMGIDASEDDIIALNFDYDKKLGNIIGLIHFLKMKNKIIKANGNDEFFSSKYFKTVTYKYFVSYVMQAVRVRK